MKIYRPFCACFLALVGDSFAHAAADVWDGNGANPPNGIWATANNWMDNTTPGNGDTATFNLVDSYTVTFNANPLAIQALTVTDGTRATFASSDGARTLSVNSATGSQDVSITGATFLTLGTSGNPLHFIAGDDLSVQSGATLNIRFDSDVQAVDFTGAGLNGTINVDGAGSSLTVTGAGPNAIARTGDGNLVVQNSADGDIISGLAVSPTAALTGGVSVLTGGNLALGGDLTIATGNIVGQSGSVAINGTSSDLVQSGAAAITVGSAANGTAAINIGTTADRGTLTTGTGTMTINATGTVTLGTGSNSGILNANGDVNVNGGVLQELGSVGLQFKLATGKTVTVQNGGSLRVNSSYNTATNAIYNVTGSGSNMTSNSGSLFVVNGATINVTSGGTISSTGSIFGIGLSSATNATLLVDGSGSNAIGGNLAYWGYQGGTANVTFSNEAVGNFAPTELQLANTVDAGTTAVVDVLSGADLIANHIVMASAGGATTSATLNINGAGSTVTLILTGIALVGHSSTGTAAINIGTTASGASLSTGTGTMVINNTGTVTVGSGANTGTLNANGGININGGTLHLVGGVVNAESITLAGGGTFDFDGGTLHVDTFNGNLAQSGGTLAPGSSPGTTTINGNYTINAGKLGIEIGGLMQGSQFDFVDVNGNATLAGTLEVTLIDNVTPVAGNSFDVLDWNSLSGTFDTLALPALGAGLMWNASQLYTEGVLNVFRAGDYNGNGTVDAADYVVWRNSFSQIGTGLAADGNINGRIDTGDYNVWRANFGQVATPVAAAAASTAVPEPAALVLLSMALPAVALSVRRRSELKYPLTYRSS